MSRIFDFDGRSKRSEYWAFIGIYVVTLMAVAVVTAISAVSSGTFVPGPRNEAPPMLVLLIVLHYLVFVVPFVAITIRRLHDFGTTGWLSVLCFVPYVGALAVIVYGCIPGDDGPNKWGAPEEFQLA